jgi:uncharacterized protein YdhG (YjbR/CyaY superfamily)
MKPAPRPSRRSPAGAASPIDAYLAGLEPERRAALARLREQIRAAAPEAVECIAYGIPGFRQDGYLVGFAAAKGHCSFFPGSGSLREMAGPAAERFDTSKGTLRFQPDDPPPAALVRRMVKIRLAENARKLERMLEKPKRRPTRSR